MSDALERLVAAGGDGPQPVARLSPTVQPDLEREQRKGVPEVVLADRKQPEDVLRAARAFLEASGRAIISRVRPDLLARLRAEFAGYHLDERAGGWVVVVRRPGQRPPASGGRVAVISAGTSDVPVAEEAVAIAEEMGCEVFTAYDVGVAGIHRLVEPLRALRERGADCVIVAAGMDGALPSVVAGLVDVPVIGLPTSVGYGLGGGGVAAILTMLQTCSPGLAVVNIDNGVGAGATAALIANRVARARAAAADHAPRQPPAPHPDPEMVQQG
jgi:NCAIR mutase (PurE)-related protein